MATWQDRWTRIRAQIDLLPRPVRLVAVAVVGGTVVLTGVAMQHFATDVAVTDATFEAWRDAIVAQSRELVEVVAAHS